MPPFEQMPTKTFIYGKREEGSFSKSPSRELAPTQQQPLGGEGWGERPENE
jgi:hypothetical protein